MPTNPPSNDSVTPAPANKVHYVDGTDPITALCGVTFPWLGSADWNSVTCPECRKSAPDATCPHCGLDKYEHPGYDFETCPRKPAVVPIMCKCGHSVTSHDRNGCWHQNSNFCLCKKSNEEVYVSRVSELEAALKAIRYEAGNPDAKQACENIVFEADAALSGVKS